MIKQLKDKIIKAGGFVNSHAHFDRAYTVHNFSEEERKMHLHEKWKLNDKFKRTASVDCYRKNIERAVQEQIKFVLEFYNLPGALLCELSVPFLLFHTLD